MGTSIASPSVWVPLAISVAILAGLVLLVFVACRRRPR